MLINSNNCNDVRNEFGASLISSEFLRDRAGRKMLEIVGASFIADEDTIFGEVNRGYVDREINWYESMSLNVNDIQPPVPEIWKNVAARDGTINSNYGWAIWSKENGDQYTRVLDELRVDHTSRRGLMIYTRPSMWIDYCADGRSDFMCTNAVQYMIRQGQLHVIVQMRSNDAVFGYKNDYAWQLHVQKLLARDLNVELGPITWQAGSLHVYERHFYLVHNYINTAQLFISKSDYASKYPGSLWK